MNTLFIITIMLALLFFVVLIYHKEHFSNPPPRHLAYSPDAEAKAATLAKYAGLTTHTAPVMQSKAKPIPIPVGQLPPQMFDDTMLRSSVIPNAPAPSGTDQTGKLMYSAVDLQANIENINNKLSNLNMNMPYMVGSEVENQLSIAGRPRMIPIPG